MLTRKHFRKIADIIANTDPLNGPHDENKFHRDIGSDRMRSVIAYEFASWLSTQNPNFDAGRFIEACKIE
jgi:hypothetical protein